MNEGIWDSDFAGVVDCKMAIIASDFRTFKNVKMTPKIAIKGNSKSNKVNNSTHTGSGGIDLDITSKQRFS